MTDPRPSEAPGLNWRTVPAPFRTLARWLTVVQAVGYAVALVYVYQTTRLTPGGVATRYRGADSAASDAAMQFPKSFAEMLLTTHNHVFGLAAIFALSGLCVAFCTRPSERWRRLVIAEPFGAILVSFSAMWLMRYVDPRFAWLLIASSSLLAATFYLQAFWILREVGLRERWGRESS